jgi:hypothetical protein
VNFITHRFLVLFQISNLVTRMVFLLIALPNSLKTNLSSWLISGTLFLKCFIVFHKFLFYAGDITTVSLTMSSCRRKEWSVIVILNMYSLKVTHSNHHGNRVSRCRGTIQSSWNECGVNIKPWILKYRAL